MEKYLNIGIFFTLRNNFQKKNLKNFKVFDIKKWSQTFLNMPIRDIIQKNPSLQQYERLKLQNRMKLMSTVIFAQISSKSK